MTNASEPPAVDARRSALLTLYTTERTDQQAAVQLNLAAIAAGLAYAVPVGALLLSKCSPGAGCRGTGDAILLLAPLPSLGLLGFLLANQALIERRARYLEILERQLAALIPSAAGDPPLPYFAREVLTKVYGSASAWYMRFAVVLWAVAAFTALMSTCVASLLFLRPTSLAWIVRGLYLVPILALLATSLETIWVNLGAPPSSRLRWVLRVVGAREPAGYVESDASAMEGQDSGHTASPR